MAFSIKENKVLHSNYRPDIDGLRAIAVLSVVVFHAFPNWLKGGFVGVDIFFVISGFLISGIILVDLEQGRFSIANFYKRRIKRIFPALLTVLCFTYFAGWFLLLANEYSQLGKHVAAGAAFISNIILWLESGYFDNAAASKPLLHLWSLGVEEQFYVFWPLILWGAWRKKLNLLVITCVVAALSFSVGVFQTYTSQVVAFYSPLSRFWELMLGAILAYTLFHKQRGQMPPPSKFVTFANGCKSFVGRICPIKTRLHSSIAMIGAILVAISLFIIREDSFPGVWALLPTLGAFLIVAAGRDAWLNRVVLANRLFVGVGLISYPLYLWHWPLLSFAKIVQSDPTPLTRGILVLVSILLAWLTYLLIEKPVRFRVKKHWVIFALLSAMAVLGGLGLYTSYMDGFNSRAVVNRNASINSGADGGWPRYARPCAALSAEDAKLFKCLIDIRGTPKYALLGDSKAGALFPGLFRTSLENRGWIYFGSGESGPLVPVFSSNKIYGFYHKRSIERAVQLIGETPSVKDVVITTSSRALFNLKTDYSIDDLPSSPNFAPALEGLDAVVTRFISYGKDVVLVVDNPTLPHMEDCINRKTSNDFLDKLFALPSSVKCYMPIHKYIELSKQYRNLLSEIEKKHPGKVRVFDATSIMCDDQYGVCAPAKDGHLLYGITDHISDYASSLVGRKLNAYLAGESGLSNPQDRPVKIVDWGGRQTVAGQGVNVQPDGTSALWIKVKNVSNWGGDAYVYFGAIRAKDAALVRDDLLTTDIPKAVIDHPGRYEVVIVEASGRRSHVGYFDVK